MDQCNLCKNNNYRILEQYNVYTNNLNINYYFYIDNKFYQCICYNKCSQYALYKDKNVWLNYIGLLFNSNSIINILYKNELYTCINIEFIPKDTFFIKNVQMNENNKDCIIIDKDKIINKFNKKKINSQSQTTLVNKKNNKLLFLELKNKISLIKINNLEERVNKIEYLLNNDNDDFYKI
jgi:hypothetical protein